MLPFLFQINGVTVEVVTDNNVVEQYVKTSVLPCAIVDKVKSSRDDVNGIVYVPSVFHTLSKKQQTLMLSHECGHVALKHLDLVEEGVLLINNTIEAEADKWAADIHGINNYIKMLNDLTTITLNILKEYIADKSVYMNLEETVKSQAKQRIVDLMLLY